MANNNGNDAKTAHIAGIFLIISAVIAGLFLVINTLVQQGKIDFGLPSDRVVVTPIGTPLFLTQLQIDSSKIAGVVYWASQSGTYIFEYADSAAVGWQLADGSDEIDRWSTM